MATPRIGVHGLTAGLLGLAGVLVPAAVAVPAIAAELPPVAVELLARTVRGESAQPGPARLAVVTARAASGGRASGSMPRLADPDVARLNDPATSHAIWRNIAFPVASGTIVYGPRIGLETRLFRQDDPNRLGTMVTATTAPSPAPVAAPMRADGPGTVPPASVQMAVPAKAPDAAVPSTAESLRAAIVDALRSNPDIQIALARQDDARYGVDEATAAYLPHMDVAVALGNEFNEPQLGASTMLRRGEGILSVRQNLWDFGTTINDIKRARAAYRAAQWGTREKIEAVAYEITAAYLTVLERQRLLDLGAEELAAHEKILKMVTTQNDLGLTTPADVSRARARLENVQAQIQDRRSGLEQAREAYRRLTDHLPRQAVPVPSAQASLPADADAAVAMIADRSPRMAQAVQDRRSIERQRASQTGNFFPKIGLQAQANWKDDVQGRTGVNRDARAMATVTYSFLNGGADLAVRNRLSARLREADYEVERRRREVEQDIRIDFNGLEAARAKMATIDAEIASSQKVVQLYVQQFREGKRSVFDLLDSQQILFDARGTQLTNGTARQLAEFRVLQKLGGLFDLLSQGEKLPPLVVPAAAQKR